METVLEVGYERLKNIPRAIIFPEILNLEERIRKTNQLQEFSRKSKDAFKKVAADLLT